MIGSGSHARLSVTIIIILIRFVVGDSQAQQISIDRSEYLSKLQGMWLGECIANWTGIQTEGRRTSPPFYTDGDWSSIGFVLDQDPWLADDDTDIEYVYFHLLNTHSLTTLTADQIRNGWMTHINSWIWVSNARVREMFNQGILTPATTLLAANELAIQIDAQLTTEIFGALAPGIPSKALEMANLPILTTANSHAAHASQFHVLLYSLIPFVDTLMTGRDQALWLIAEARKYLPESSKAVDIIDFVRDDFLANEDVRDWESTRDKIYNRYQLNAASNGFYYAGWTESSINFASTILALLYGEMDYRRTVQIGTLSGWDSDNPTATLGGLLGLFYGYDQLVSQFPEVSSFSDRYNVYRTRDGLPDYLPEDSQAEDTFTLLSDRMLPLIDMAVIEAGGSVQSDSWLLPQPVLASLDENPLYNLQQRSANHNVAEAGGNVTASSSVSGSEIESIADGFEHDFSGSEWYGNRSEFISDITDSALLTVIYDRDVPIHTVRLIEGYDQAGYSNINVEIYISDQWVNQLYTIGQVRLIDSKQPLQIIDLILNLPVEGSGIRLSGPVDDHLNILELDALSEPQEGTGNIPPIVKITSPALGETFLTPVDLTIQVEASDIDGNVSKIEFYNHSQYLGEDETAPYSLTLNDLSGGYYNFKAKAIDNNSAISNSDHVWIIVSDSTIDDEMVWHSYDVSITTGSLPVIVFDENMKLPANIEFYVSSNDFGVKRGNLLSVYNTGQHWGGFNKVENFWSNISGWEAYPYAGKSRIERGSDSGEDNTPEPYGVYDLQLHPPESNKLIVASFNIPVEGNYEVSDLAVRRVHNEGNIVRYYVFDQSEEIFLYLNASNNQNWVGGSNTFFLGHLSAGNRIFFAVGRGENDNYYWDATELTWTIKKLDSEKEYIPDEYVLFQNYPNPFNPLTTIRYLIPEQGHVRLIIYDILGRRIRTLIDQNQGPGIKSVNWDGRNNQNIVVSNGVYVYILETPGFKTAKKMVLVK
jgi:hypothetical protein